MTLPQMIFKELIDRLSTFEPPPFGKVKIEIEMGYCDGQRKQTQLAAYPVETLKG